MYGKILFFHKNLEIVRFLFENYFSEKNNKKGSVLFLLSACVYKEKHIHYQYVFTGGFGLTLLG